MPLDPIRSEEGASVAFLVLLSVEFSVSLSATAERSAIWASSAASFALTALYISNNSWLVGDSAEALAATEPSRVKDSSQPIVVLMLCIPIVFSVSGNTGEI